MKGMILGTTYGAIMREEPIQLSKPIKLLDVFDVIDILESAEEWTLVKNGKFIGWIRNEFISQI